MKKVLFIILTLTIFLISCEVVPSFDNHEDSYDHSEITKMEKYIEEQFVSSDVVIIPDEYLPDDLIAEINEQILSDGGEIPESYNMVAMKERPPISRAVIETVYDRTRGSHDNNCSISGHSNCSSGCSWGTVYRYSYWSGDWLYQVTYRRSKNNQYNRNCCTRKWEKKQRGRY